jgi:hypothetical protein
VIQHRIPVFAFNQHLSPEFRAALDGVVDHVVFSWQRGRMERRWLVQKPIRVLAGPEAASLGGHGEFELGAVRPPSGRTAWTEVDVLPRTGQPEDLLVLEVGGDINVMTQLVGAVVLAPPDGSIDEVPLTRAIGGSQAVVIVFPPFGQAVDAKYGPSFRRFLGVDLLVARSPVYVFPDMGATSNGPADLALEEAGEWREGDRVLLRVPLATLRSGAPGIVLAWRDRIPKPQADPNRPDTRGPAPLAS